MGRRIFVLGSANMDLVFAVDRLPCEGETLAGGDVVMIGAVGDDPFGQTLLESLNISDGPTGCACIYVMPGRCEFDCGFAGSKCRSGCGNCVVAVA